MKILTVTTLYPNAEQPNFGVFVENRLCRVAAAEQVELRVVAPVPWFPSGSTAFGRYGVFARVPAREKRHGIEITHPRYPQIPKIGMHLAPFLLYQACRRHIERVILPAYDFDLIDAHFYYPDGAAAALLGRYFKRPVVVTARGTDLNLYPRQSPLIRRMITKTAEKVDASITVCAALKDALVDLGAEPRHIHVLRNGVDLSVFRSQHRSACSAAQKEGQRTTLLSVGHLIERKGHDLVIRALTELPDVELLIAGDGPERRRLEQLTASLGLQPRVRFLGVVAHRALPDLYSKADLLVLASSREGWPNVLLEALACGTPVVATRNWGTPEIVSSPEAGCLVDERTPEALAHGIKKVLAGRPDRARTRKFAEAFSWDATTEGQLRLFSACLKNRSGGAESLQHQAHGPEDAPAALESNL